MLAAQKWIATLFTATAPAPQLADLGIVAGWLARQSPAPGEQPGRFAPASAARTAGLAAQAMTLLGGEDQDAITAIRALLRHQPGHRPVRPAGLAPQQRKRLSGPARGRLLRALDPSLSAADRLRSAMPPRAGRSGPAADETKPRAEPLLYGDLP